jgi:hypothetical protein
MIKHFNPRANHPTRAVQAWQILMGLAMNRQTIRYRVLETIMHRKAMSGDTSGYILGHIAAYCIDNNLPELNLIVVNAHGLPGHGILVDSESLIPRREEVYDTDWYNIRTPSEEEFRTAFEKLKDKMDLQVEANAG